jgi:PhoPQ-activated pathogenicity-related protein
MNRNRWWIGLLTLTFLNGANVLCQAAKEMPERTGLDDYVGLEDDSFAWKIIKSTKSDGMQTIVLDMTSQKWRTQDDVNRTKWQHWVTIAVPAQVRSNIGFMWIGGGRNGGDPPDGPSERVREIARATQTVVAEIGMIPNQPLVFHNDGQRRSEDDLIAYTWVKFLETGDATWPARNPMVKSVVRAMDAVTQLLASDDCGNQVVDQYVVAGGSKRGWTTWLVGAVDKRVVGIAPIVIDILNLEKSMNHQFAAYGFYGPAVGDYVQHKLVQATDHPRLAALRELVDPYHYRHRLKMPKFIMNAAGDEFFPPDMSRHYFDELQGEKYLRYVPNANHSLRGTDAVESLIAFYSLVLAKKEGPKFSWTQPNDHSIRIETVDKPEKVLLWQATNPKARDFRIETLGPKYTSQVLEDQGGGVYVAEVSKPKTGWTAFFVELTYDVGVPVPLKVTSNVNILPDVFPFADKDPTLPTSLTVKCRAASEADAAKIKAAMMSDEIKAVADDPRLVAEAAGQGVDITINWVPTVRFEESAGPIVGFLEKLGCTDLTFQIESGRPKNVF